MEGNWLRLDNEDGWEHIVPDCDIKPHANIIFEIGDEIEAELAEMTCPCCPVIDYINKLIIHNAFDGRE